MPPTIYLIRHGETAWSLSGQHTGRTDITLTARGEAMARAVGTRLAGVVFSSVISSPRIRARHTAELADLGAVVEIDEDLAEWNYGDYEGMRSAEIQSMHSGWDVYRDGCPHGESPAQISERADRLIARLRSIEGKVAVFSHGHFGRALAMCWIGLPLTEARHFLLDPASLCVLGSDPAHPQSPVILLWNESPGKRD